jgi:hypothetical protein
MNRLCLAKVVILTSLLLGLSLPTTTYAHGGGTPRLTSAPAGPYRVYAWSEPEPWRVGEAHLSIAVTKPNPDGSSTQVELPVTDAEIEVTFTPIHDSTSPIVVQGTHQSLLDNIYYEADTILPSEGIWRVTIDVIGPEGSGAVDFSLEALPPRTINWTLVGAAGGVLVILFIVMGLWARAQQSTTPQTRRTGARRLQRG